MLCSFVEMFVSVIVCVCVPELCGCSLVCSFYSLFVSFLFLYSFVRFCVFVGSFVRSCVCSYVGLLVFRLFLVWFFAFVGLCLCLCACVSMCFFRL